MLRYPTPATAFPQRAQRLAVYAAQYPVWAAWQRCGSLLWSVAPTLDAAGLTLASQISQVAAHVLDTLYASGPQEVSFWVSYGPQASAAWQTWIDISTQPLSPAPTQTVAINVPASNALQALRGWDPMRQNAPPGLAALLQQLCENVSVIAAPTLPQAVPTASRWVTVSENTTLLQLADQYLGHPEDWIAIRRLNHLRAPYISARLWDQYGPPILAYVLSATELGPVGNFLYAPPVSAGATTITLPGALPELIGPGVAIVLETTTAQGRQQEVHFVTAFNATNYQATVADPVQATYPPASLLSVNLPPAWVTTRVVAPGDPIQIPLNTAVTPLLPNPDDPFGTDFWVDAQGVMHWTGTGDIATATGIQNLQGALRRRLDTLLGTLPLHPRHYGSGLPTLIGNPAVADHVIQGYVRMALLPDPRVVNVNPVTVRFEGTTYYITAHVQTQGLPEPITVATAFGTA